MLVLRGHHCGKPPIVIRHFMKIVIQTTFLVILSIFSSCSKFEKSQIEQKKVLLTATQNFYDVNEIKRTFIIYSDSTYLFTENLKEINHSKIENFEGTVQIEKDSIKFHPFKFNFNKSETAVLKNGFIEFVDGEFPDRMKIAKTTLDVKNNLDINKFPNYSVFTFYKKFNNQEWQKDFSNYDLNTQELSKIDQIFKKEFSKNQKLRNFNDYLKQIVAVKNNENQILIQAKFFCKESPLTEGYQYYEMRMHDGGNCNVYFELNLTTEKFNVINIAGIA
jgi:hypothetical protein